MVDHLSDLISMAEPGEGLWEPHPKERCDLKCGDCGALMVLRNSEFGPFYGCTQYPQCKGTHGAHVNGAPKGRPANKETRLARIQAHKTFDPIWQENLVRSRKSAYSWMQKAMGLTRSQAHISQFDIAQCEKLIRLVYRDYPKLRTRYTRLIYDA
jgi:ssDNA-binding Zn-finger/Zn-ribbon topoisomerase 1